MPSPIDNWQAWGFTQAPRLVRQFDSGENHQCWLIQSEGKQWVVKRFEHSFEQALQGQQLANDQNLAPLVNVARKPWLLMEFIEHETKFKPTNHQLKSIAASLAELHGISESSFRFDLLEFANGYLDSVSNFERIKHQEMLIALDYFVNDTTPWCFCHNDLVLENIVIEANRTRFLDWEFAGLNNPWFDIAAILVYADLSADQTTEFLNAYGANVSSPWSNKQGRAIFWSAQVSLLWLDLIWHAARDPNYRHAHQWRYRQVDQLLKNFQTSLA